MRIAVEELGNTSAVRLIEMAEESQSVRVYRGAHAIAEIRRLPAKDRTREFGLWRGKVEIAADFDEPWDEAALIQQGLPERP